MSGMNEAVVRQRIATWLRGPHRRIDRASLVHQAVHVAQGASDRRFVSRWISRRNEDVIASIIQDMEDAPDRTWEEWQHAQPDAEQSANLRVTGIPWMLILQLAWVAYQVWKEWRENRANQ